MHIEVESIDPEKLSDTTLAEDSAHIRERVVRARQVQQKRYEGTDLHCNADLNARTLPDDGVFFTPKSLVKMIVNVIEPSAGTLLENCTTSLIRVAAA